MQAASPLNAPPTVQLIVVFGAASLAMLTAVQGLRIRRGGLISTNFSKSFGLILVATLGAVLVLAGSSEVDSAPAFTLLGTVAGYLATSRPEASTDSKAKTTRGAGPPPGSGKSEGMGRATGREQSPEAAENVL